MMNEQIMAMLNELRPEFDFMDSDDFIVDGLQRLGIIVVFLHYKQKKYAILHNIHEFHGYIIQNSVFYFNYNRQM